jgi:hypothetical protein
MPSPVRVYLETGKTWTFACALDWPGWCRRGRGTDAALETLSAYAPRYSSIAGDGFDPGELSVIGEVRGDATTDFGAPGSPGPWEDEPVSADELERQVELLESSWRLLDAVVAGAPSELRKGPRGGGRERDAIAEHVREAERTYGRKAGLRLPPRTPWREQRAELVRALTDPTIDGPWPRTYALRRIAWHVTDHAWEIEDRS